MESWQRQLQEIEGYIELEMFDEAEQILTQLPKEDGILIKSLQLRCLLYLRRADWSKAAALADVLTQAHPEDAQNWINFAYATRRSESIEQAEIILNQALKHHPEEWCIHYNLACYAAVEGRIEQAKQKLERAVQLESQCRQMALNDPDLKSLRKVEGRD